MVHVVVFHLYASQHVVPTLATGGHDLIESTVAHLLQVEHGLLHADERRCHAHVDHLATACLEAHDGTRVVVSGLELSFAYGAVGHGGLIGERLVEDEHKKVFKVLRHTAAVLRRVAHNHLLLRQHLHMAALIKGVDHDVGLLCLGEGETHGASTLCGSQLSHDVIVGKVGAVIIRLCHFCLVREPRCTLVLVEHGLARLGHDGELSIVVNPRTGLVCLLKAADFVMPVDISPSVTHLSCLRHPEVHAPRHGDGRIGVAC